MRTKALLVLPLMGLALAGCSHVSHTHSSHSAAHSAVPAMPAALKKVQMKSAHWFLKHPALLREATAYCNKLPFGTGYVICSTVSMAQYDAKNAHTRDLSIVDKGF